MPSHFIYTFHFTRRIYFILQFMGFYDIICFYVCICLCFGTCVFPRVKRFFFHLFTKNSCTSYPEGFRCAESDFSIVIAWLPIVSISHSDQQLQKICIAEIKTWTIHKNCATLVFTLISSHTHTHMQKCWAVLIMMMPDVLPKGKE